MSKPFSGIMPSNLPGGVSFSSNSLRKLGIRIGVLCLLLILLAVLNGHATPSQPTPPVAALPDYGTRSGARIDTATASLPSLDPAAQAGRAIEALIVVLAGTAGILYFLKRAGVGTGARGAKFSLASLFSAKPAVGQAVSSGPRLTVQQSEPLPGGGMLHLVIVADRTLLLSASGQNVSLLAEWEENIPSALNPGEMA